MTKPIIIPPTPESLNYQVKDYIESLIAIEDPTLRSIRLNNKEQGLPEIQVPSHVGKLLYLLAKIHGAKRILEIGTLGAYSTVWLARALPSDGKLISLEIDPQHVQIARQHIEQAQLTSCVEIWEGKATEILSDLIKNQSPRFDFVFIDADKENNTLYLDLAIKLSQPRALFLIDNLIPKGECVGRPCNGEAGLVYQFNEYFANHPLLEVALIPTLVGQGRIDGLGIAQLK